MKTNILVIGALPPPSGGMETVTEQMHSMKLKDYDIKIFNVAKNRLIKSNLMFNSLNFAFRCLRLAVYLTIHKVDIVHIHVSTQKDIIQKDMYQRICKMFKKKTILHMHGSNFKEWYASLNAKQKMSVKRFLNDADSLIVLSPTWAKYYSTIYNKNAIQIINNAIEDIASIKSIKHKKNNKEFVVLFLGNICRRKGAYDLLEAISLIKNPDIKFVFVGPYEDKKLFFHLVDKLKIGRQCTFVGEILGKDRLKYFAQADAFILPSYAEGLPVAILEAMAFGLPILSTNAGAIPEVVDKKNGIIFDAGNITQIKNAVLKIAKNKEKIPYSSNNRLKIKKNYTQEIFKSNLIKTYENIRKQ